MATTKGASAVDTSTVLHPEENTPNFLTRLHRKDSTSMPNSDPNPSRSTEHSSHMNKGQGVDAVDEIGQNDSDDDDYDDDDDDEDLVLEGVLVKNPDVASSSSEDEDVDEDEDEGDAERDEDNNEDGYGKDSTSDQDESQQRKLNSNESPMDTASHKSAMKSKKSQNSVGGKRLKETGPNEDDDRIRKKKKKKKKKKKSVSERSSSSPQPEIVNVDFAFCDMDEKYFHGLKTLLINSSSELYSGQISSQLSDLMIENVAVGTVVSTDQSEDQQEGNVYGFASVLNITTYQSHECIQLLKNMCMAKCPHHHRAELDVVLSGTTKRPAGFLFQSRMVNLPMEIVMILHEQLIKDIDWAVQHAVGTPEDRKALDFGAFVRFAPSLRSAGGRDNDYKYFDDEVFAGRADIKYTFDLPKTPFGGAGGGSDNETSCCTVLVLSKTGHRAAMDDLRKLVNGTNT